MDFEDRLAEIRREMQDILVDEGGDHGRDDANGQDEEVVVVDDHANNDEQLVDLVEVDAPGGGQQNAPVEALDRPQHGSWLILRQQQYQLDNFQLLIDEAVGPFAPTFEDLRMWTGIHNAEQIADLSPSELLRHKRLLRDFRFAFQEEEDDEPDMTREEANGQLAKALGINM